MRTRHTLQIHTLISMHLSAVYESTYQQAVTQGLALLRAQPERYLLGHWKEEICKRTGGPMCLSPCKESVPYTWIELLEQIRQPPDYCLVPQPVFWKLSTHKRLLLGCVSSWSHTTYFECIPFSNQCLSHIFIIHTVYCFMHSISKYTIEVKRSKANGRMSISFVC